MQNKTSQTIWFSVARNVNQVDQSTFAVTLFYAASLSSYFEIIFFLLVLFLFTCNCIAFEFCYVLLWTFRCSRVARMKHETGVAFFFLSIEALCRERIFQTIKGNAIAISCRFVSAYIYGHFNARSKWWEMPILVSRICCCCCCGCCYTFSYWLVLPFYAWENFLYSPAHRFPQTTASTLSLWCCFDAPLSPHIAR